MAINTASIPMKDLRGKSLSQTNQFRGPHGYKCSCRGRAQDTRLLLSKKSRSMCVNEKFTSFRY